MESRLPGPSANSATDSMWAPDGNPAATHPCAHPSGLAHRWAAGFVSVFAHTPEGVGTKAVLFPVIHPGT